MSLIKHYMYNTIIALDSPEFKAAAASIVYGHSKLYPCCEKCVGLFSEMRRELNVTRKETRYPFPQNAGGISWLCEYTFKDFSVSLLIDIENDDTMLIYDSEHGAMYSQDLPIFHFNI